MRKQEFIDALRERLRGLPSQDVEERVGFYAEMIDDRMEEGLTEAVAVADMGDVEDVVSQILAETPLARLVKEKIKPKRRLRAWEIVLLALGSPIWLTLLISAFAVVLSLYVSTWAVVVSLWACFASFAASALGGIVGGAALVLFHGPVGLVLIAAGLALAGLAIFSFYGCKALTKGVCRLTPKMLLGVKRCFVGKGEQNA